MEKVSVFIKIRVLFWPEISALGVFFNFDNERMRPPKYPSAPPPPGRQRQCSRGWLSAGSWRHLRLNARRNVRTLRTTGCFCYPGRWR